MSNDTATIMLIDNLDLFVPSGVRVLRIVFVMTASLLGVIGNSLVATVMYNVKQKNSTDWLVFFMAIIDLYCSTVLGFTIFCRSHFECWDMISGNIACRFHYVSVSIAYVSSSMLLTMVAIDRYFKTCKPLTGRLTTRQSKMAIVIILVTCVLVSLPNLLYSWSDQHKACIGVQGYEGIIMVASVVGVSLFFIMFVTVIITYKAIYGFLRSRQEIQRGADLLLAQRTIFTRNNKVGVEPNISRHTKEVGIDTTNSGPTLPGTIANMVDKPAGSGDLLPSKRSRCQADSIFIVPIPGSSKTQTTDISSGQQTDKIEPPSTSSRIDQMSKTYRMMAFITVIFIASWVTSLCSGIVWTAIETVQTSVAGRSIIYIVGVLNMINWISNPFLYLKMSSLFRQRLMRLIFEK